MHRRRWRRERRLCLASPRWRVCARGQRRRPLPALEHVPPV